MFSSDISIEEMRGRVFDFRARAEAGIDDKDCIDALLSLFGSRFSFPTQINHYEKGTLFYRARAIPFDDADIPFRTIWKVGDAWEPPTEVVKVQGRLNAIHQSILYCCAHDPFLAITEARANGHKHVAVIVYRSRRPVGVSVLGNYGNSNLPKDLGTKFFYSFLDEEFSRHVPAGGEGRYSITRAIADSFFNYPEQDAWCYRSVQSPDQFNTAFLPGKSKKVLDLVGVLICNLAGSYGTQLSVDWVVDFDEAGDARYHRIGTEEQRKIFPSITPTPMVAGTP